MRHAKEGYNLSSMASGGAHAVASVPILKAYDVNVIYAQGVFPQRKYVVILKKAEEAGGIDVLVNNVPASPEAKRLTRWKQRKKVTGAVMETNLKGRFS